jgi:hypothetical protein
MANFTTNDREEIVVSDKLFRKVQRTGNSAAISLLCDLKEAETGNEIISYLSRYDSYQN